MKEIKWFRNMKIGTKIGLLLVWFLVSLIVIGAVALNRVSDVNAKVVELNDTRLVPIVSLEEIKSDIEYIRSEANSLMSAGNDDSTKQPIQDELEEYVAATTKKVDALRNNTEYTEAVAAYDAYITEEETFVKDHGVGTTSTMGPEAGTEAAAAGDSASGEAEAPAVGGPEDMDAFDTARTTVINAFEQLVEQQVANAKATYDNSKVVYNDTITFIIISILVSALIVAAFGFFITRSITVPVKKVTSKLKEIASSGGDLTQRIDYSSKDEIGELSTSFNEFADKLQLIIKEVSEVAEKVAVSSEQLNVQAGATSQSLNAVSGMIGEVAASSSDGAAIAEETTASLTEAAAFSESTSQASSGTTASSRKARAAAEDGAERIAEVVASITDIAESSKHVSGVMIELDQSSKRIGEMLKVISDISEQTNLLALNAAIEAARAGEAGRGFSVVAEQIRKLADESSAAAKQIGGLVKENALKSSSAVHSVKSVENKVSLGVEKADQVSGNIEEILSSITNIVEQIEAIEDANVKQAHSAAEMTRAMDQLSTASSEIAEGTDGMKFEIEQQLHLMGKVEQTTTELTVTAKQLRTLTSGFTV
ncbi:HAMP domain-containing methyl-accepting chemotaxis protein [Paenibacillus pinistramenti]|uniref:HAMP domain-containing methyl-accepting chemotaxis protein n=1 Tax=Paenibacillus pinistramenti TaxID=1768003 RepID=UPI00139690D9|nr:methyl-accepting chemotaxis protein [Paenibacillus pinistramenti]